MTQIQAMLPAGLDIATLVTLLAAGATFFSVLALWYGLVERDRTGARVRMIQARRDELRSRATAVGGGRRHDRPENFMADVVNRLKLVQSDHAEKIRTQLARAGKRTRDAVVVYLFAKLTMPMAGALAGFLLFYVFYASFLPPLLKPVLLAGSVFLGFYGPDIYLSNLATKRRQSVQKALPDALDLLVICAEAGLSLENALNRVADEMANSSPEIAEEIALTAVELSFLPERRQALLNLGKRVDLPAVRAVATTLVQTEKYGTPLSQSLRVLSSEFRDQRMMKAEEKAARLPATLTVPMIVFILPTLFIVLAGPAMISVYDSLIK